MEKQKILVVEDDKDIQDMLLSFLQEEEYDVILAKDGVEAISRFQTEEDFDIILLDLMLPKKNGIEVLTEIRQTSVVPVIIVSAKESDFDKSVVLGLGADDYVTKPFSLIELQARIKSNIRRSTLYQTNGNAAAEQKSIFLDLVLDHDTFSLYKNEERIPLTNTEYNILKLFLENPNKVFTKENIYEAVWKEQYYGDENIVNVHMSRLRDKIELDTKHPKYIQTLWGIGYRLKVPEGRENGKN